jgi:hypothetical protein
MTAKAKTNVVQLRRVDGLSGGYRKRKAEWYVPGNAPKTADDLTFTSRDSNGCICWWDVTLPKTDYWHAHVVLGRAYAFEFLDLINNPEAEEFEHILSYIVSAQMRWRGHDPCGGAIVEGFHQVISEYVVTGSASR